VEPYPNKLKKIMLKRAYILFIGLSFLFFLVACIWGTTNDRYVAGTAMLIFCVGILVNELCKKNDRG